MAKRQIVVAPPGDPTHGRGMLQGSKAAGLIFFGDPPATKRKGDDMKRLSLSYWTLVIMIAILSAGAAAAQSSNIQPEKSRLEVAIAGAGSTSLPLLVTLEGGYFNKHGLTVNINRVSASSSVQGVMSGTIDIYQGGAAAIAGNLRGADIIYVAAAVDKSSLNLFGQKEITTFEALRGKAISTTSPGAFGEIAVRGTARRFGVEIGKDIKLLYHRTPAEALATFLLGNAEGLVITPPQTEVAKQKGYPVIIDYYKEGLKIIGPGTSLSREFARKYPNTVKAYLMAYIDGLRRTIDDEEFAKKIEAKYTKITDSSILNENYQQGLRVWNRDMTVDPAAIRNVLENSSDPSAKSAELARFYDNSLIQQVNREYASKLFPGEVK